MRKLEFYVGTMFVGSDVTEIVEVDDNITDDEIYERFNDWLKKNISAGWNDINDPEDTTEYALKLDGYYTGPSWFSGKEEYL